MRVTESEGNALQMVSDGDVARGDDYSYRAYGHQRDMTDRIYRLEDAGRVVLHGDGSVTLTADGTAALLEHWKRQRRQR